MKSVSFASVSPSVAPNQPKQKATELSSKIPCLCNALKQDRSEICCIGFVDHQTWQHHIYTTSQWICKQETTKFVSLHEHLAKLAATQGFPSVKER